MTKPTQRNELASYTSDKKTSIQNIKNWIEQAKSKPTDSEILIKIAKTAKYFKESNEIGWAEYDFKEKWHVVPVNSKEFEHWLRLNFYYCTGGSPTQANLKQTINLLIAHASYDSPEEEVFLRFGYDKDGKYYFDLGDKVVELSEENWKVIEYEPGGVPKFYRPKSFLKLPIPEKGGNLHELKKFLNVKSDEHFRLICAWMISTFNPKISTPVLIFQGEQGTAKSTNCRIIRSLIDPNHTPLRQCPKEVRDLFISSKYSASVVWDNLSGLPDWASDALSRLCTGGGFSTRELYTDTGEILLDSKRPIILNGIDSVATRGDLLDRSIVIECPEIDRDKRKSENILWNEFSNAKPHLLGCLLDLCVVGIKYFHSIDRKELPRMADFGKWCDALSHSPVWEGASLLDDYDGNQIHAIKASISSDSFATAISHLMKETDHWEATATRTVEKLEEIAKKHSIKGKVPSVRKLKNNTERLKPLLRRLGIHIQIDHNESGSVYSILKR